MLPKNIVDFGNLQCFGEKLSNCERDLLVDCCTKGIRIRKSSNLKESIDWENVYLIRFCWILCI